MRTDWQRWMVTKRRKYTCFPKNAVGSSKSYGNYVKIRHTDNLETIYCHCEAVLCREGDRVSSRDVIGRVGSTGVSPGPHLHLSVLAEGYYIDPMNLYR